MKFLAVQVKHTQTTFFPFHKIYLAPDTETLEHLTQGLPCCLILDKWRFPTLHIPVDFFSIKGMTRGKNSDKVKCDDALPYLRNVCKEHLDIPLGDCSMVVPILQRYTNWKKIPEEKLQKVDPAYLSSPRFSSSSYSDLNGPITRTVQKMQLKLPSGQKIKPCLACDRALLNYLGQCRFLDQTCITNISVGNKSQLQRNLTAILSEIDAAAGVNK